jgi:hypothetical protein
MSEHEGKRREPAISLWVVVPVIGVLGIALAGGLNFFRTIDHLNRLLGYLMEGSGLSGSERLLNPWALWLGSAVLAFGLTAAMLNVAGAWRRWFILVLALALTVSWAPVLLLASYKPEIGVAVIAVLWSGCCAMFYSFSHEMPADVAEKNESK